MSDDYKDPFGVRQDYNSLNFAESINDPQSRIAKAVRLIREHGRLTKRSLLILMYNSPKVNADFIKLGVGAGILACDNDTGLNILTLGPNADKVAK